MLPPRLNGIGRRRNALTRFRGPATFDPTAPATHTANTPPGCECETAPAADHRDLMTHPEPVPATHVQNSGCGPPIIARPLHSCRFRRQNQLQSFLSCA